MDAMAEALAQAEGEQDMEKKIEQALACPCLGEPLTRPRLAMPAGQMRKACSRCSLASAQTPAPRLHPGGVHLCVLNKQSPLVIPLRVCPAGDLKEGPCGPVFVHAFGCFIRSEHEDKGMDCLPEFAAFQVGLLHRCTSRLLPHCQDNWPSAQLSAWSNVGTPAPRCTLRCCHASVAGR